MSVKKLKELILKVKSIKKKYPRHVMFMRSQGAGNELFNKIA